MMKNNCKNRKLTFIRIKNSIRMNYTPANDLFLNTNILTKNEAVIIYNLISKKMNDILIDQFSNIYVNRLLDYEPKITGLTYLNN